MPGLIPSMRPVASTWCHSKGKIDLSPFFVPTAPYVLVEHYKTLFVASMDAVLHDSRVSSLYTANIIVRTFLVSAAEFEDERKDKNKSYNFVDSRTVRVREDVKLTYLVRISKIVRPMTVFFLHVSHGVRWKFEYASVAGVKDKTAVTISELEQLSDRETCKIASPPRLEEDEYFPARRDDAD